MTRRAVRGTDEPSQPRSSPSPVVHGRPRSPRAHRAVLDAARSLIEARGYHAATIEEIAAHSGVAKTTIYRRWANRPALVLDLLLQTSVAAAPPPAGPDPLGALRTELARVAKASDELPGQLLVSLLDEAQHDPEVRSALDRLLFKPRRRATARVIRRAQAMGLLRRDVPPLVAVDLLFGPLFYRRFVRQESVTESFIKHVFAHFLAGLGASRDSSERALQGRRSATSR